MNHDTVDNMLEVWKELYLNALDKYTSLQFKGIKRNNQPDWCL